MLAWQSPTSRDGNNNIDTQFWARLLFKKLFPWEKKNPFQSVEVTDEIHLK